MLVLRSSAQRGFSQLDWLKSQHTFSFDQYYDPKHMSFGPLRVINEDHIAPGAGFGTHPHRNMEIITYVIKGQLRHQDSLGTGSVISAGEIQKMSAGSGIMHSEFNASQDEEVHLLQIWIVPNVSNLKPKYEQERFELKPGELTLLGAPQGGLVSIHQNVNLYGLALATDMSFKHNLDFKKQAWIQVVKGECVVNSESVKAGDGIAISETEQVAIQATSESELLIFELY
jgi:redox-sensitive bicupin YhaK (pirin superfamily)